MRTIEDDDLRCEFARLDRHQMRSVQEAMETMRANVEILAEQIEMTISGLAAVTGGLEAIPNLASTVEDLALQLAAARGAALHATSTTARHTREQGRGPGDDSQGTE